MTKIIPFPPKAEMPVINEEYFEKFSDSALLLHCFESVNDAVDYLEEGGAIQCHDDSYVQFIEVFWALQVLFKRKTGASASEVSAKHWDQMRKHLLEGGEPLALEIPLVSASSEPIPPSAYDGLSSHALACASFNYADNVRIALMDHSPKALDMAEARITAINATTALRRLVLQLAGGSIESYAAQVSRRPGETLQ